MSVYKHQKSGIYHFDFWLRGHRFCGSTSLKDERKAREFERAEKDKAREELKRRQALGRAPLTFHEAAARYWIEVGQHHKGGGDKNTLWSLEWLEREIGRATRLPDITSTIVARLVAKRRAAGVANATVNRSVTEPLRKILNRAARIWH